MFFDPGFRKIEVFGLRISKHLGFWTPDIEKSRFLDSALRKPRVLDSGHRKIEVLGLRTSKNRGFWTFFGSWRLIPGGKNIPLPISHHFRPSKPKNNNKKSMLYKNTRFFFGVSWRRGNVAASAGARSVRIQRFSQTKGWAP